MKNLMRMVFFLLVVLWAFVASEARAEEKSPNYQILGEFEDIKTRLANVEKQQQEIAAKDAEILAKLDQLRVWVHRK